MKRNYLLFIVLLVILSIIAGGMIFMKSSKHDFDKAVTPQARDNLEITEISATLEEQMSSGIGGTVDVEKEKNSNTLVVTISAANSANLTASIKSGECSALGQEVYSLGTIQSNPQTFEIAESKENFISKLPLSVVLQDDQSTVVSCGKFLYEDESEEAEEANSLYQ
jgi:hypothetical protein